MMFHLITSNCNSVNWSFQLKFSAIPTLFSWILPKIWIEIFDQKSITYDISLNSQKNAQSTRFYHVCPTTQKVNTKASHLIIFLSYCSNHKIKSNYLILFLALSLSLISFSNSVAPDAINAPYPTSPSLSYSFSRPLSCDVIAVNTAQLKSKLKPLLKLTMSLLKPNIIVGKPKKNEI